MVILLVSRDRLVAHLLVLCDWWLVEIGWWFFVGWKLLVNVRELFYSLGAIGGYIVGS